MGDQQPRKPDANDMLKHLDAAGGAAESLRGGLERTHRLATLGTVAAGIAHEINNILTPAIAYTELVRTNPDDAELRTKALEKINKSLDAAICIAGAILGFVSDHPQRDVADVDEVVRNALECVARNPARDGIRLSIEIEPGTLVAIAPVPLQQVLLNLLLNACNVLRGRGGSLKLTAIARADGTTLITVADTGPGIPPEIADCLFEPFVTRPAAGNAIDPDAAATGTDAPPRRRGSGLGLAICKQIIERSRGTITFESAPDQGTTFRISLPTATAARAKAV